MKRLACFTSKDNTEFLMREYRIGGPRGVLKTLDMLYGDEPGEDVAEPVQFWPETADVYWDGAAILVCQPAYLGFSLWRPDSVSEALSAFGRWTRKSQRHAKIDAGGRG